MINFQILAINGDDDDSTYTFPVLILAKIKIVSRIYTLRCDSVIIKDFLVNVFQLLECLKMYQIVRVI